MGLSVWWHFQFGWTRTNQEVSQYIRGFSCFSCLTGMAPAQAMTRYLLDGSRNRRPFCCLGFFPRLGIAGYEPKCYGAWVNSALCAAMDRRRRQLRETADERLDRLIAMERNSRISSPVPEVRRLMVEEGRAAASSPGPRRDGRGEGEAAGSTGLLPVGSGTPVPEGLLAPLFQDLGQEEAPRVFHRRLDEDDETSPAVVAELSSAVGAGQLSAQDQRDAGQERGLGYRDGMTLLEAADGLFGHDRDSAGALMVQPGVNAFWSSEVRRAAALEGVPDVARPQALPPLAGPPVSYGPGQAHGEGCGGSGHLHPGGMAGSIGPEQASRCAAGGIGPEQALLRCASGGTGPEQASWRCAANGIGPGQASSRGMVAGAGPEQALVCAAVAGGAGPVQAPSSWAATGGIGPGQALGAEGQQAGLVQTNGALLDGGAGSLQAGLSGALSQPSPEKSVEALRLRIVKAAEESFIREAKKLKGEEPEGEVRSYHTASSGPGANGRMVPPMPSLQGAPTSSLVAVQPGVQPMSGHHGLHQGGQTAGLGGGMMWSQPVSPMVTHSPGTQSVLGFNGGCGMNHGHPQGGAVYVGPAVTSQSPDVGLHGGGQLPGGLGMSANAGHLGGGMTGPNVGGGAGGPTSLVRPPGLGGPDLQQGVAPPMEPLRGSELPLLPQPGTEQSALQFGDWITVVTPMIGDVAGSARGWWGDILQDASSLYDRWLTSTPLERIRLRPTEVQRSEAHLRLEQRVVPMLLKCVPESIKQDLIASRTMTVTGIMYRLWTVFQPGGSSERVSILKQLTEPKVANSAPDLLGGLRRWRRLMSRSMELSLALPDPIILGGVLHRFADALGKLGGTQLAYRVASVRQELGVDIRPLALSIEQYAEYLQSEAEELSLGIGLRATTAGAAAPTSLKAMVGLDTSTSATSASALNPSKAPCKFWKTVDGCRRGSQCTFLHETSEMKGQCFKCGSSSHLRKDCTAKTSSTSTSPSTPAVGPAGDSSQPKKVSKVKATSKSAVKDQVVDPQKGAGKATNGGEAKPKEMVNAASGGVSEGTQGGDSTATEPMGEPSTEAAAELMREATSLLKSIRSLKAVRMKSVGEGIFGGPGEYALLDGGATHGLRQARPEEEPDLIATKVELACGSTTLFKHPKHQTLLSRSPVEPIIPLAWLVAADYKITWKRDSIVIHHPTKGPLQCSLRGGCPVMSRAEGWSLLGDLEKMQQVDVDLNEDELKWWSDRFPQAPHSIWRFMKGQGESWRDHSSSLPWNRHRRRRLWKSKGIIVHLFSGRNHKQRDELEQAGYVVLTVDTLHGIDLHDAATWAFIWELACAGKVVGILGGPPCRTTSRLRQRQPGPPPLRGRDGLRFHLEGLSTWDLHRVNSDRALLFKQLGLFLKAEERRMQVPELHCLPTAFALESPEDPMEYLGPEVAANFPSFWNFPELKDMVGRGQLRLVSFDQSQMGHVRRKPTTVLGNLPGLEQLDGLRDSTRRSDPLPRDLQASINASKDWASWAPGLVAAFKVALRTYLHERDQRLAQRIHKLNVEEWKRHIRAHHHPYRRDCRRCMELAGVDSPHRRSHADSSAYVMPLDLVGPYPVGRDDGRRQKGKYIMVATVPLPMLERADIQVEEKADVVLDEKETSEGPEEPPGDQHGASSEPQVSEKEAILEELEDDPDMELVGDEAVNRLNQAWLEHVEGLKGAVGLQNVTLVEILESRHIGHIVEAASRVFGRFRALGVPILRVHTDREKSFLSKPFQHWCMGHALYQTMTSGDDGPANGRVEAEVGQIKRRLRVLLATSGLALQDWPGVARWAGEERLRNQLQKMGVPSKPMVPLGGRVVVKTKRWHKQGPLAPPFKSMVLMGPSPNMTNGWVLRDGKNVQHARAVVCPAESGETAVMELYDASTRRVTGKQPPYVEDRKVPQPLQHDELPLLLQGDLGAVGDSNDVWGEARNADQGEDVMSLGYSPDEMPQDKLHEGDEHGSEKEMPALLRAVWAGGSAIPLQ